MLRHCTRLDQRSHGAQGGSEGRASPAPWRSAIAGAEMGEPRDGRAVGGASMGERERADFRRDCGGVRVSGPRNVRAGCGRAAQEAFCGAVGVVALVQPSGFAIRTESGEMTRLRESDGRRGGSRRRSEGTRRTEAGA